jgi:polyisoprenoid-binding protein YceI
MHDSAEPSLQLVTSKPTGWCDRETGACQLDVAPSASNHHQKENTMTSNAAGAAPAPDITATRWRIDPSRSRVEFHVAHFYGLMTVKGRFDRYDGFLDLASDPAVELTIDAASLDTGNTKRDTHLRSEDFFHVQAHPRARFTAGTARLDGDRLHVAGRLEAAGTSVPLELDATVRQLDRELEVHARTTVDHRLLGMTWSPMGIMRTPSKLIVNALLVPDHGS